MKRFDQEKELTLVALARNESMAIHFEDAFQNLDGISAKIKINGSNDPLIKTMNGSRADIFLLDTDLDREAAMAEIEEITNNDCRNRSVIITAPTSSTQQMRHLFHLGIADFVPQPATATDLRAAVDIAIARFFEQQTNIATTSGGVVTFIRSCGGVGATTLMLQIADCLALEKFGEECPSVGVLDFDLQFGDAALTMDLESTTSLGDILDAPERFDADFLLSSMLTHESGIRTLAAPKAFVPLSALNSDLTEAIVKAASETFDFTLIDMPHSWPLWSEMVLNASDLIVLVTQVSVSAIHRTRRILKTLEQLALEDTSLIVVANKYEPLDGQKSRLRDAAEVIGRPIGFSIRTDAKIASEARDRGIFVREVSDRCPMLKDMREVAGEICIQLGIHADEKKQKGWQIPFFKN